MRYDQPSKRSDDDRLALALSRVDEVPVVLRTRSSPPTADDLGLERSFR